MYNGQPPQNGFPPFMPPGASPGGFRPMPGMPPPTLAPNPNAPPPQFPPFAPGQGGFRPPPPGMMPNFPPSRPPGFSPSGPGGGPSPSPSGMMPRPGPGGFSPQMNMNMGPGGMGMNGLPPRPMMGGGPGMSPQGGGGFQGMGTPGFDPVAAGLPRAPHLAQGGGNPNFIRAVKTTTVFIGSIAPGITDAILTGLIQACGPLHKLNRVSGPTGKPQAFGFAEFEDPEVVLRVLKCLNGVELPDMTPKGRSEGASKNILVKADEKTRGFLDEFEELNLRTDHDEELDQHAKKRIQTIADAMRDPTADLESIIPASAAPNVSAADADVGPIVPDHLKDLNAEELPEDQRGVVLDQIASFRVQAQKKEDERRKHDELLHNRNNGPGMGMQRGPMGNMGPGQGQGPGNNQMRQWGQQQRNPNEMQNGPTGPRAIGDGPQGYNQPVGFVKGQTAEGKQESVRTDEENERMKQEKRKQRLADEYRNIERRIEARENRNMRGLTQEANELARQAEVEAAAKERARRDLEEYDDDAREASGRDVFFADRGKWRSMRQAVRRREYAEDVRDRQGEEDEMAELERQTEELLQKQMQEMAELEAKQKAAGYLQQDPGRIKVALGGSSAPAPPPAGIKQKATTAFGADDEDEAGKKKRKLITLDDNENMTPAQREEQNRQRLATMKNAIPLTKAELWAVKIHWEIITDSLMNRKIIPFVRDKIASALGEPDEDLISYVIQHVREKASPDTIVQGLEDVLDEDAFKVVRDLWRLLAFESTAYNAGLDTGSQVI